MIGLADMMIRMIVIMMIATEVVSQMTQMEQILTRRPWKLDY